MIYCKRWQAEDVRAQCGAWRKALLSKPAVIAPCRLLINEPVRASERAKRSSPTPSGGVGGTAQRAAFCRLTPPDSTFAGLEQTGHKPVQPKNVFGYGVQNKISLECSASANTRLGALPHARSRTTCRPPLHAAARAAEAGCSPSCRHALRCSTWRTAGSRRPSSRGVT